MSNFEFYTPTHVYFGRDTQRQVGDLVRAQGCKKVLVHFGGQSARRSGLLDQIEASLDAAGVAVPEAYQGVSLLGYTRGEAPAADREAFLCEHLWELDEIPSSEGIRTERWKYMRYRFIPGREELYDLAADSEEAVNLASDPAYGRTLEELRRECDRQIERYVSLRRH